MLFSDNYMREEVKKTDFPRFEGKVKFVLHNCQNHKDEFVFEKHNDPTNALADIFAGNYGGLVDYDNFTDLFKTWLGGVLVFAGGLDTTSAGWANDYGIPARTSNACIAHAGQTPIGEAPYDQADDTTRGNPDNSGMVTSVGSTKLCWEWGTSAGNAPVISSLGLTHTDVGSYGCGVASEAQKLLRPFAQIGCKSKSYTEFGDNAKTPFGVNGNMAYGFYLYDDNGTSKVHIYKTPMNVTKYKLQGSSLVPLSTYTTRVDATLSYAYGTGDIASKCYYHWDFANNKLVLFGVKTEDEDDLYKDTIDLDTGTVTHQDIEVTGAKLWKFRLWSSPTGYVGDIPYPTKAMIYNGYLFLYGTAPTGGYNVSHPRKIYKVNLSNTTDISEVNTTDFSTFDVYEGNGICDRYASLGGIIVHDNYLINGDKTFETYIDWTPQTVNRNYANPTSISSPCFGIGASLNSVAVNKLYLATKWNLDSSVAKTSAMSMRIEYSLTEV